MYDFCIVRALGTRMNNAFNDPIQDIMIQYGLKEEIFFKQADEITLAGPFSNVKVLLTDKK